MATIPLPSDFSEFLRLLSRNEVRYLLVGGYAVGYHGYVRATADMDIWVDSDPVNASRIVASLREFGFDVEGLSEELFTRPNKVVRMGLAPARIELLTSVSGVTFGESYDERVVARWDDVVVHIISLDRLLQNKRAAGRYQDLSDLEHLGGQT